MTPSTRWRAENAQRQLRLFEDDICRLTLPLDQGGRHRLIVQELADLRGIVATFDLTPGVTVLPANGGLLGAATVAENLALALHYGSDPRDDLATEWEAPLQQALQLAGMSPERIARIGREQPMNLARPERLLLGMIRHILRPPDVLVLDHVFSALTRRESDALITLEALFHDYHPFRPALFVDLDTHGLPDVPDCRSITRIEEAEPCLS